MANSLDVKISPMMIQWQECKIVARDALLLFRLGDFYEAFYEDAELLSKELDLTLTKRQDIPMSGIPAHTVEGYIDRLVCKGYKIAVAEQTEEAKKGKGLVKREVKRFVTKATNINPISLSEKANNYFASIAQVGDLFGLSFVDVTTGECHVIEIFDVKTLINELSRMQPAELLISRKFQKKHASLLEEVKNSLNCTLHLMDDWQFDHKVCYDFLIRHFRVMHLDGFGLKAMIPSINALGALLSYLQDTLCQPLNQIKAIQPYTLSSYMSIDRATLINLELVESSHEKARKNSLLDLLDKTHTPMGARLFRRLLLGPLLNVSEINDRQDAVASFLSKPLEMVELQKHFSEIRDLERLIMRIVTSNAGPRDLLALKLSFKPLSRIKDLLKPFNASLTQAETKKIETFPALGELLEKALVEEPPLRISEGPVFKAGYCKELDELSQISQGSKTWMLNYQEDLKEVSGIRTLKVGYTQASGFYIEVSKGQVDKVPNNFIRRQTLTNAERFITPLLKEYEEKVLQSEERIAARVSYLFQELRQKVSLCAETICETAQAIAKIDFLLALAVGAREGNYVRPLVDDSSIINIKEGRHPVIECLSLQEKFIANDTELDSENNRMMLITGPNMAGKSTYMRQVALITIMAQIGSFVPARSAHIGIIDKLFTRIGASDDLARGQSTFMVEMTEAANILHNTTSKSLVILDEIGRGTSTYDGISIAWSIAEYLLSTEGKMPKTLFATHYFELTKLEEKVLGVLNYTMAVHESGEQVLFLRKVIRGKADRSYGIHVALLAGLPKEVIQRSKEILNYLEEGAKENTVFDPVRPKKPLVKAKYTSQEFQLTFFS